MTPTKALEVLEKFEQFCSENGLVAEWCKSGDGVMVKIEVVANGDVPAKNLFRRDVPTEGDHQPRPRGRPRMKKG